LTVQSLERMQEWSVNNLAGAVVTPEGVRATVGDTERVFALASVTKLLVAFAALIAVEEGAIELDQPAGPEGSTARHLLAHTSGLAFDSPRVQAEPGTRRIYSSAGFEVLADLIATETGIEFPEYLRQAVFEPLGMTGSGLTGSAGHGAQSTVADLARFAAELLAPRLIAGETLAYAVTVQFPGLSGVLPGYGSQRPNDWGLGFELRDGKAPHWTGTKNSPRTFGHFGQSGTFLWVDQTLPAACIALTDRAFGDWAKPLWTEFSDGIVDQIRG
jgi:CubicO group peptidase (beta-lactamase class C family)